MGGIFHNFSVGPNELAGWHLIFLSDPPVSCQKRIYLYWQIYSPDPVAATTCDLLTLAFYPPSIAIIWCLFVCLGWGIGLPCLGLLGYNSFGGNLNLVAAIVCEVAKILLIFLSRHLRISSVMAHGTFPFVVVVVVDVVELARD